MDVDFRHPRFQTLFELGFRPFFLMGMVFAPLSLVIWLEGLYGPYNIFRVDSFWHAHEMMYGFVLAIVAGFLLTATQNWTGKPGVRGSKLLLLVSVWLLGRLGFLYPGLTYEVRAGFDLAFLPLLVWALTPYLVGLSQRRNLVFLFLILCLWFSNLIYHLNYLRVASWGIREVLYFSVHIIILMIAVIGGRVIPFFSSRVIAQYRGKKFSPLDLGALALAAAFPFIALWGVHPWLICLVGLAAGLAHLMRLLLWYDKRIWRVPILWILYVGYIWLVLGYFLSAIAAVGAINPSLAIHAFTAGAIGTMIVGMVSRVSLGHTGRKILASPLTVAAYFLITLSAMLRVLGGLLFPHAYVAMMVFSGTAWVLSFVLLLGVYIPILIAPRPNQRSAA